MTSHRSHQRIRDVAIVGAGLGGLAAAAALARRGVEVAVYERASALGEVGAGVQMSPNAMKALASLGVAEAVRDAGFEPVAAVMRRYQTGRRYLDAPLRSACEARYGAPYVHIHRADLHAILANAATDAGASIHLDRAAAGCKALEGSARIVFETGEAIEADALIGADGVRSVVRDAMLGPERPVFTGQTAWRGVAPASALPDGLIEPSATVWVGPGRHFVTYYLRGGSLVNFVAVEERSEWRGEGWTEPGDLAELRRAFAGWGVEIETLLEAVDETFLWGLFGRETLPRWSDGRVALLGDACHPTLPFMAQGAAMALEDAAVLAALLTADLSIEEAFRRYEAHRKPRATMLQAKAAANAKLFHMDGPAARAKLAAASLLPRSLSLKPLDAVYRYDPVAEAARLV